MMVGTDENPMAQKKRGEEAGEHDIYTDQRYKKLEKAAWMAKMDASNIDLGYDSGTLVRDHLKQAFEHLALAKTEPEKREEHIQAGFDHVGKVTGILGQSPVLSDSFRRHQWPFLLPGME
jgi:hypothetical protein